MGRPLPKSIKDVQSEGSKAFPDEGYAKVNIVSIYFQGILPAVLYCILIWGNCSQTLMNSIKRTHVLAARFIFRLKKLTLDLAVLIKANWKLISYYYKGSIACKGYKIYYGLSSPLLSDMLQKSTRRTTRNALKVDLPTFKYPEYKRLFRYRAAIVWKNLPSDLRKHLTIALKKPQEIRCSWKN